MELAIVRGDVEIEAPNKKDTKLGSDLNEMSSEKQIKGELVELTHEKDGFVPYISGHSKRSYFADKSCVNGELGSDGRGNFWINRNFANGAIMTEYLVTAPGQMRVHHLYIEATNSKYLVISFGDDDEVCVLVDCENFTENSLYKAILASGIRMSYKIKDKEIKSALFKALIPYVNKCDSKICISGFAGWENGTFKSSKDVAFLRNIKCRPPIVRSDFNTESLGMNLTEFWEIMNLISNKRTRLAIFISLFAGILYSLFYKAEVKRNRILCLITSNVYFDIEILSRLLTVFNRPTKTVYDLRGPSKKLEKILYENKDTSIVFRAFTHIEGNKANEDRNVRDNIHRIIDKFTLGESNFGSPILQALPIIVTNQDFNNPHLLNVYLDDKEFEGNLFKDRDFRAIGSVMDVFIYAAENNYSSLMDEITRSDDAGEDFWYKAYKAIKLIFDYIHCDFFKELEVDGEDSFRFLWNYDNEFTNDISEFFVQIFRGSCHEYCFDAYGKSESDRSVLFDTEFIYIPELIFDEIITKNKITAMKNEIIHHLKKSGKLVSDRNGGTVFRHMNSGRRLNYYRILREFLSPLGCVEIVELGRGKEISDEG